ncbi:MAG TPA: Ig-like domain-containing protein [Polyangiaceae bacterium]|nr:Ig-like domain-containing protein [Polyangiaceae bacterium]
MRIRKFGLGFGLGFALVVTACEGTQRGFRTGGAGHGGAANGGTATNGGATNSGGERTNGGSPGSGGSDAAAGSDGGSDSDAGADSMGGDVLSVVSVSPSGNIASTRDEISVTFNQPVTQASANDAVSIEDGRGKVAGSLLIDGNVVRFRPRGALCFDQNYQLSIAATIQTANATQLGKASSFSFKIPDGLWQSGIAVGPSVVNASLVKLDIDLDGNTLAAWEEGTAPALNYYDAEKKTWNGARRPTFTGEVAGESLAVRIRSGHAIALFRAGLAESANGLAWSDTSLKTVQGSAGYFRYGAVAMASDDTAAFVWSDSYQTKPTRLWSAFRAAGGAWLPPTSSFVEPETFRAELHELPDNSFLAVYERRLDQLTPGNVAARRYTKSKGWSGEKLIAAGGSPVVAYDSFGGALMTGYSNEGNIGAPVARYDAATDLWSAMPDLPKVSDRMSGGLALAGEGTGYVAYVGSNFAGDEHHIGLQRLVGKKWDAEEVILPSTSAPITFGGITADDCGNLMVVWTDTDKRIIYARRYTVGGGWGSTVTLTKTSEFGYPYRTDVVGNAHGELVVPYSISGTGADELVPSVLRFE